MDNFFARAWELTAPDFAPPFRSVWRFLEAVFRVPIEGPPSFALIPPLDQVFSLVDWSLHAGQGLGPQYGRPVLSQVRRDLEQLICMTLRIAITPVENRTAGPHARFARCLLAKAAPEGFGVLSLNYDTLLDDALAAVGAGPDYGFRDPDLRPGRLLLAKLHGSLNWALCTACDHVEVLGAPGAPEPTCTRCGSGGLHRLIISPTWLKNYHVAQLRHVWDLALECIRRAHRLVLVGYSMPPADVAIYQLIIRGLLIGDHRPAVEVVNHHRTDHGPKERRRRESEVRAHFTRLFGPGVRFDFSGFHGQA